MDCTMPCFPVLNYFPELAKSMFNELVRLSNHLILSHPLLLLSFFPRTRVFPNELAPLHWVAMHSCISISPYNEYSGLISFRIDWFDLPAVQWTLKSHLQHQNLKAILWHSVFFIVQLSYPYWLLEKSQFWLYGPLSAKWCLFFSINCLCLS